MIVFSRGDVSRRDQVSCRGLPFHFAGGEPNEASSFLREPYIPIQHSYNGAWRAKYPGKERKHDCNRADEGSLLPLVSEEKKIREILLKVDYVRVGRSSVLAARERIFVVHSYPT